MNDLFMVLLLFSIIGLIVGLIQPKLFSKIFKKKTNRKTIGLVFSCAIILFFILFGVTANSSTTDQQTANKADKPSTQSAPKPDQQAQSNEVSKVAEAPVMKSEIIKTANNRYDGGITYYVLTDPINLENDSFKNNIKDTVRKIIKDKGPKISIEFHDNKDSLDVSFKQYGDKSLGRPRTKDEDSNQAIHFIATFSGQLSTNVYLNSLDFFPATFTSNPTVGKYVEGIEFNP